MKGPSFTSEKGERRGSITLHGTAQLHHPQRELGAQQRCVLMQHLLTACFYSRAVWPLQAM